MSACLALLLCALPPANEPPLAPVITEPVVEGQLVNPADVHMEVAGFSDPDPGDLHAASDWEIWSISPSQRVWSALSATGLEALHAHLGDGVFEGALAGAGALLESKPYQLRTRHRDASGDPATEWGPWSTRGFTTGLAQSWFALELEDVADLPAPAWRDAATGAPVDLQGGASPAVLTLETGMGALLYEVRGQSNAPDAVLNPPEIAGHFPVRARFTAGGAALALPPTDLELYAHGCERHVLLLPAINIAAGQEWVVWLSSEGLPFFGTVFQTEPSFGAPLRLPDPPWIAEQPGFVVETVAGGLQLAVDVAFAADPGPEPDDLLCYVSELYGAIRTVTRDGTVGTYASDLLDFDPTGLFPGSGEQGLTCLAVEPATGDVFAALLYKAPGGGPEVHYPKVVRFSSLDGGFTAASATTILDFAGEPQGQSHQISNLELLPDHTLLVHMGDGFAAATAQNPLSYRGKILRAFQDGTAPPSNPFYDAADGIDARDYTYALGLRNPFGGDFREADGFHYEVENGPSQDRFVRVAPGMNVGWDGTSASMQLNALYLWSPSKAPVDLAFAQDSAFGGGGFPAEKLGHAFVSLSGPTYASGPQNGAKRIVEFVLDDAGSVAGPPVVLVRYTGYGKSSIAGLAFGPDGLYFTTLYADPVTAGPTGIGASLLRVRVDTGDDCNGNGVGDACDVAFGTSPDCNANGEPDECEVPLEEVRLGTPPNPDALRAALTTPPAVGATWDPVVDHAAFAPGAVLDVLLVSPLAANLPTPIGTLLCQPVPSAALVPAAPGVPFAVPIPAQCAHAGLTFAAQAASVDASGAIALTNALDVTLGF